MLSLHCPYLSQIIFKWPSNQNLTTLATITLIYHNKIWLNIFHLNRIQWLWKASVKVQILAMSIPATHRRKHYVAACHFTFMELPKMDSFVMGSECPFVTICFLTDVTGNWHTRGDVWETLLSFSNQIPIVINLILWYEAQALTGFITIVHW